MSFFMLPEEQQRERIKEIYSKLRAHAKELAVRDLLPGDPLLRHRIELEKGGGGVAAVRRRQAIAERYPGLR